MSRHPVTPMHEADLRRHLAALGWAAVSHIDLRLLDAGDEAAVESALQAAPASGTAGAVEPLPPAVLFDTTGPQHLARIGRLLWPRAQRQPLLALGASSVAQALIAQWQAEGLATPAPLQVAPAAGPVFVLAGSLSPVTAGQVAEAARHYETVELHAPSLVADGAYAERLAGDCAARLRAGRHVLARTSLPAGEALPPLEVAQACGRVLARVLANAPLVRRIGVAGGDTSSFALRALDPWALRWVGPLAPGIGLLRLCADASALDGLELILKGGQIGAPDLFERLLAGPL